MGDIAIARQLQAGIKQAIDKLGQEIEVTHHAHAELMRDPDFPTRAIPPTEVMTVFTALIADFEEELIDGELVMKGDMRMTVLVNGARMPVQGDFATIITRQGANADAITRSNKFKICGNMGTTIAGIDVSRTYVLRK